jgi:hypothetical protein
LEVLRQNYPMMKRYVEHLTDVAKNGIAAKGLGDWSGKGASPETPGNLIATALYYEDAMTLAKSAKLLGNTREAAVQEQLAAAIKSAFNTAFYQPETHQYGTGSQCANSFAIALDLVDPADRQAVLDNLVTDLEKRDYAMTVGEVGLPYMLRALAGEGRSDVIHAVNNRTENPGYSHQLKMGATALCETWNANRDNSQIQFMLGHIMEWFYHDLAGIQPDPQAPGFSRVVIRPNVVGDLTEVKAGYDSVRGKIVSEWKRDNNRITLRVVIPPNVTATIYVPAANQSSVTEGGKPTNEVESLKFLRMNGSYAAYEAGSGDYTFSAALPLKIHREAAAQ